MSITPKKNTIMEVFSINKQYFLDFYQRDYQWKQAHVDKLIEDLFYRFDLEYRADLDISPESISKFDWYYLSAYVTNDYQGRTYVVDGQQRLTTLTLLLIKLFHLTKKYRSKRDDLVKEQITGAGLTGRTYWMGDGNRKGVLEDLFVHGQKTAEITDDDISIENLYENYKNIDRELEQRLDTLHKLDAFVLYLLTRVQLVNIQIQDTKDVPMVFEVINDRGERLKPYEVLKGKLLGQIDKNELDHYYSVWQHHIHALQMIGENEVDDFFRFYFRSKYVDSRVEWREFDGDYHKAIYEEKWDQRMHLKRNVIGVKQFITNELDYYARLYLTLRQGAQNRNSFQHLFYNDLNDQDRQYVLVMSSCQTNDPDEAEKIRLVSKLIDKHFTLLQLTGSYDSNKFTESIIELNKNIRDKSLSEIETIFSHQLLEDIQTSKGVAVKTPLEWVYFSNASKQNLPDRFIKYYFARIEHFIAENIGVESVSYYDLVRRTGWVNGYQIEHILAHNDENLARFNLDEELFNSERNKVGALVLLQGRDNQSSNNEVYEQKRKIYATRPLLWNKTLAKDFYHKNPNLRDFMKTYNLNFKPYAVFDINAIQERQRLLFDMTKLIWE